VPESLPTADQLRAAFERHAAPTVGLEEELMLLDASTLDLAPRAAEVVGGLDGDPRFKLEMPAAQLEIVTAPHDSVAAAAAALAAARRRLAEAVAGRFRVAGAGAHPFASGSGPLNPGARYEAIGAEYAGVARRQLVFGLHVHVAVGGADRALAVYNALRAHLPELAGLAACAPFYEGRDSGLASVRSRISGLLPRQGVPPALASFEAYADALRWCSFDDPRQWWWELRLHPTYGTVELRVPDTQATVADTAAVAEVAYALMMRLAARHDAGEPLPAAESWRIDQNRWAACRHGLDAVMTDPFTGERATAYDRLARALGADPPRLDGARRHRALAAEHGLHGLVATLADEFLKGSDPFRFAADALRRR
jgi:glutamate---cysteine ligase / carboxylate-amine ligase